MPPGADATGTSFIGNAVPASGISGQNASITSFFNQLAYLPKILAKAIDNNINRVYISFYPYTLLGI